MAIEALHYSILSRFPLNPQILHLETRRVCCYLTDVSTTKAPCGRTEAPAHKSTGSPKSLEKKKFMKEEFMK